MIIRATVSLGFEGCEVEEDIHVPDEWLKGLSEEEIRARTREELENFVWNKIELSHEIIEE